ncbi:MAG: SCO family protein [Pseudomonadota bacterium]
MSLIKKTLFISILILSACTSKKIEWHSQDVSGAIPILEFNLTAETGKEVNAQTFKDKVNLLFFGFADCPHICPMTLDVLAQTIQKLDASERAQINVLFVGIDPRDTPARLKEYTQRFGPEFIGLTGTQENLKALSKKYLVTYDLAQSNSMQGNELTHSSIIYAFDREGKSKLLMRGDQPKEHLVEDVRNLISIL